MARVATIAAHSTSSIRATKEARLSLPAHAAKTTPPQQVAPMHQSRQCCVALVTPQRKGKFAVIPGFLPTGARSRPTFQDAQQGSLAILARQRGSQASAYQRQCCVARVTPRRKGKLAVIPGFLPIGARSRPTFQGAQRDSIAIHLARQHGSQASACQLCMATPSAPHPSAAPPAWSVILSAARGSQDPGKTASISAPALLRSTLAGSNAPRIQDATPSVASSRQEVLRTA